MNEPTVVPWSAEPGVLSEGPRWHEERGELLWVDILGRQLHRGTLADDGSLDRVVTIAVDRHVGAVAPVLGGGYMLAAGPGFLFVDEDGAVQELAQPEAGRTDVRMNDGACDAQGRFWASTMAYDESPGRGTLYRLELDASCTTVLTGLTISNGIGWSPDGETMYLNDSGPGTVESFRFDGRDGSITDRRTLVRSDDPAVVPDGSPSTWRAASGSSVGGGTVNRYAPDGSLLASVKLPVERPTVCVRRPEPGTLFVTPRESGSTTPPASDSPAPGTCSRSPAWASAAPCEPYRGLSPEHGERPTCGGHRRAGRGHHRCQGSCLWGRVVVAARREPRVPAAAAGPRPGSPGPRRHPDGGRGRIGRVCRGGRDAEVLAVSVRAVDWG